MSEYKTFGISLVMFLLTCLLVNFFSPSTLVINLFFLLIVMLALIKLIFTATHRNFDKISGQIISIESLNSIEDNNVYDILSVKFEYDGLIRNIEIKSSISGKYQKGEEVSLFVYNGKYKQAQLEMTNFLYVWTSIIILFLILVYFGYKTLVLIWVE